MLAVGWGAFQFTLFTRFKKQKPHKIMHEFCLLITLFILLKLGWPGFTIRKLNQFFIVTLNLDF